MRLRRLRLLPIVIGVATNHDYDATIDLLFDEVKEDTAMRRALAVLTAKLPVVEFPKEQEVVS